MPDMRSVSKPSSIVAFGVLLGVSLFAVLGHLTKLALGRPPRSDDFSAYYLTPTIVGSMFGVAVSLVVWTGIRRLPANWQPLPIRPVRAFVVACFAAICGALAPAGVAGALTICSWLVPPPDQMPGEE